MTMNAETLLLVTGTPKVPWRPPLPGKVIAGLKFRPVGASVWPAGPSWTVA